MPTIPLPVSARILETRYLCPVLFSNIVFSSPLLFVDPCSLCSLYQMNCLLVNTKKMTMSESGRQPFYCSHSESIPRTSMNPFPFSISPSLPLPFLSLCLFSLFSILFEFCGSSSSSFTLADPFRVQVMLL